MSLMHVEIHAAFDSYLEPSLYTAIVSSNYGKFPEVMGKLTQNTPLFKEMRFNAGGHGAIMHGGSWLLQKLRHDRHRPPGC